MMHRRGFLGMLIAAVAGVFGWRGAKAVPSLRDSDVVIYRSGRDYPLFRTPEELERLRVVGTMESMPEYWIRTAQAAFKEGKGTIGVDRSC